MARRVADDDAHGVRAGLPDEVETAIESALSVVKPRLRGWIHAGSFPVVLAASVVLVSLAPTPVARVSSVVFGLTAALLFGTSALYHRGTWSPRWHGVLKRLDHCNIFLIIAGTYTPFAVLLLSERDARLLLTIVWLGALGGVLFRVFWVDAPRWLYTPVYVALGWVAVFYFGPLYASGGATLMVLMAAGGLLYTLGAVVYGTKRPNPSPRWFGFHEIFHVLTVIAFVVHYAAVSIAVYRAPLS
jgi:hemolysin III